MISKKIFFLTVSLFIVFAVSLGEEVAEHECIADGTCREVVHEPSVETVADAIPETIAEDLTNVPVPGPDESSQEAAERITKEEEVPAVVDPKCPDRAHIIKCAGEYLDTNKNGALDRDELENAIASLPWYARGILQILGSVDKMMKKCDVDGDDKISMDFDMENNKETCLATCFKRRAFKGAFFPDCEP